MKNQSKKQIVEEAFYKVEEDEDVQELLEEKAEAERKVRADREAKERMARYQEYMWGGICLAHDKAGCPECVRAAEGECPSAIEEGFRETW
jgi:hypothetical protein